MSLKVGQGQSEGEPRMKDSKLQSSSGISANTPNSPDARQQQVKELDAALDLLKQKDDTSRFVGLALLKPVLENSLSQGYERSTVRRCWKAIPMTFMDRLLKARSSDTRTKDEATAMVNLAVAVLHAFTPILNEPEKDPRFVGRVPGLLSTLRACSPETMGQIMQICHQLLLTPEGRTAIFRGDTNKQDPDRKPDSYLFISMVLIDIRSILPSLQETLHSASYPTTSERIARAYNMLSAFIGFLTRSLDEATANPEEAYILPMPTDLLFKLRANISETLSLTIEHLRDRYDSSVAGAPGLDPSARAPTASSDSSTPIPIAWDTTTSLFTDPLTLSQIGALSLWLRDEENDALRKEAAGMMDVLMALYKNHEAHDFRPLVLVALQGMIEVSEGVEAFLREDGWDLLSKDLEEILAASDEEHHQRGLLIVRVLLSFIESDVSGPTKEEWMPIISLAHSSLNKSARIETLELPIAVCQLAVELLTQAPKRIRGRTRNRELAKGMLRRAETFLVKPYIDDDMREGLEEVVQGLEDMGFGSG